MPLLQEFVCLVGQNGQNLDEPFFMTVILQVELFLLKRCKSRDETGCEGNIHFAGEHCLYNFQDYMEGGAEEGKRAANEVLRGYYII